VTSGGNLEVKAYVNGGTSFILNTSTPSGSIPKDTFTHVLVSFDMANAANRHVYINDVAVTPTYTTYDNTNLLFSTNTYRHVVGSGWVFNTISDYTNGRLSNVFLDYTYRNLSVEANRRLFITAEGTPADGQASLSPILYLPMDDPADVGRNDGTGGNFTLNGIVARSGRGPNQYNAAASTFDGTADYLSRTSLTGITDGKVFTAAFSIKQKDFLSDGAYQYVFAIKQTGSIRFGIRFDTAGNLQVFGANTGGATRLLSLASRANMKYAENKYIHVAISFDMADPAKRRCFINGQSVFISASTHDNEALDFTTPEYAVGAQTGPSDFLDGELSDLWFNTSYIDLATDNPFYDADTGKPKFLGEFGELPTGSAPLVYLPLRADDAGNNKGTGGDFTVVSGPYVGARGPSEGWAEAAEFNGTSQYLNKATQLTGLTDSKVFTVAVGVKIDAFAGKSHSIITKDSTTSSSFGRFRLYVSSGNLFFQIRDASDTIVVNLNIGTVATEGNWVSLLFSFDSANQSNCLVYADGVSKSITFNTFTTDYLIPFLSALPHTKIGANKGSDVTSDYLDGRIGFLWFNNEYIDFSQEANRLKFFDAFGYPVDVGADGSLPTGNVPLIYMNEDFHLGTSLGSGGNFTPVNAPTDGGYVKG